MKNTSGNSKNRKAETAYFRLYVKSIVIVLFAIFLFQKASAANKYSVATGNWNSTSTWSLTSGGASGAAIPVAGDVVTIEGGYTVTVNASTGTLGSLTISSGSTLTSTSTFTVAATTITINGNYNNGSTGTITGTTTVGATGIYTHTINGGTIPTATWNATSTCTVTGTTSTAPGGLGQAFGNFTWNAPSTASVTLSNATIAGNLTISNGSTGQLRLRASSNTMTVNGNLSISGAANITVASSTSRAVTVKGNFLMTAGTLTLSYGSGIGTLNIAGDFSQTGGTITETSTGSGAIVFNKAGTQTYTSGGTISNTINFTVNSGSTMQMATAATFVSGGGSFTLASGATLVISSTAGITTTGATGSIQVTGTRTFSTGANYIYNNSTANQATGNGLSQNTPANVTINNPGYTVTLSAATNMSGVLTVYANCTLSTSTFTLGATTAPTSVIVECGATSAGSIISGTGAISLGSDVTVNNKATGNSGATISCPIVLTGTRSFNVADDGTSATDLTASGIISGAFGITKAGTGSMSLAGLNIYTGAVTINTGILTVNTLANAASSSSLGTGALTPAITISGTGTLQYIGSGHSISRAITLTGSGAIIDASGSGTATFSGAVSGATFNLILTGTGTGVFSGAIGTTTGAVVKNGTGSWTLSGASTYTGLTTISAGTLIAGAAAAVSTNGPFGNAASAITLGDANTTINNSSPSLIIGGAYTIARPVTIANQATSGLYSIGGNTAVTAVLSGTVTLNQPVHITEVASGILQLSGIVNTGTNKITISGAGTIQRTTSALTLGGDFEVNSGTFDANAQATTVSGITTLSGGTYLANTGTQTFSGGLTINSGTYTGLSGTAGNTATTNLILNGGTLSAPGSTGSFNVSNNWTNNSGTFTVNSGTVTLNGTTQTIGGLSTTTFNNLAVASTSSTTLLINTIIAGNTTVSGTLDLGTYTCNRSASGGTLTVSGTMKLGATTGGQTGSNFPTNFTTLTLTGGTINYNLSSGGQTIYATPTYSTLTLSNSSGTETAGGNLSCTILNTTFGGTLEMGTNTLTCSGTPNHQGIINSQNTSATPLSTAKSWGGTINYNAGGNQTVVSGTYTNLQLTNSGNKVFSAAITISANIAVSGNAKADLATYTSSANTLSLGGSGQASGSWGSTASAATNKSNTWFLSPSTGIINIASGGCVNSTATLLSGATTICTGTSTNLAATITGGTSPFTVIYTEGTSNYTLTGYSSGISISVSPGTSKTYSLVSVTGSGGCIGTGLTGTPLVTVNSGPTAAVLSGTASICTGSSSNLSVAVTSGTSPYTVVFTDGTTPTTVSGYTSGSNISVSPTATKTYTLTSVSGSGSCAGSGFSGNPTITVNALPTANAGGAMSSICQGATSANLGGSIGGSATGGTWSDGGAGGTFTPNATTLNATYTASASSSSSVLLTLTSSGGSCGTVSANKTITVNANITPSVNLAITSGYNPACTDDEITFTATTANTGGGSVNYAFKIGGLTVQTSSLNTYTTTTLANGNVVTCTITVTGGTCLTSSSATSSGITMTVNPLPQGSLTANGPFCSTGTGTLTWTKTSGTSPFSIDYDDQSPNDENASVVTSGVAFNVAVNPVLTTTKYTLITVTDANGCVTDTAQSSFTNGTATIAVSITPTTSNAGTAQTICINGNAILAANIPSSGTGTWSISSGPSTNISQISNASANNATFTPAGGAGTYNLVWTINNSPCTASTSTVAITVTALPIATFSYTGTPYCSNGSNPTPTYSGGGSAGTFSSTTGLVFVSMATGQVNLTTSAAGTYTVTNTKAATGGCGVVTASNTITITTLPTAAISYSGTPFCSSLSLPQSVTLTGSTGGTYTSTTGLTISASTGAITPSTSTTGTYTVTYTIASANGCGQVTATTSVTITAPPTTANAGADQTGSATCGLTSVTLAANTPTIGTGVWSVVSGTGGSFSNASSSSSTFSGTAGATYTLRWTISNSSCTASTDDVVITFNRNPTTSNAGSNQTGSSTCGLTTINLASNTPSVGTGAWTIISGTGGSFTDASIPTTAFSGNAGSSYTLRWTISNSVCTASSSNLNITFNQNPTTANAGSDQTGLATCGLTTVTLAGNTPVIGTGAWSIISGTGGSLGNASNPTSTFTGAAVSSYTLRWTISNPPCTASTDDVNISFNINPTTANAGSNQTICYTGTTLAANSAVVGTGVWSIISGPSSNLSQFSSTLNHAAVFTPDGGAGTYVLAWTISSSPCNASTSSVTITVKSAGTWYGNNSNWFDASNWCGGIPTATTNVTIPSAAGIMPTISSVGAVFKDITINNGASLTISGTNSLAVFGSWINNGTFTSNNSTVVFSSTTSGNTISGALTGTSKFNNLTFNGIGGAWTFLSSVDVAANFTITNGAVTAPSGNINIGGTWTNSATFNAAASTANFNGNSAQTIGGTIVTTFNNLTLSNTDTRTASVNMSVNGVLNLSSNNPSSSQGALEMGSNILYMGIASSIIGTGDVTGIVERTHTYNTGQVYTFGNQYTSLIITSGTLPTTISVKIVLTSSHSWNAAAINRYYDFKSSGGDATTIVTIRAHYLDSELNGNNESTMDFYDYHLTSRHIDDHGHSNSNSINNWLELANLSFTYLIPGTNFGTKYWSLSNSSIPNFTWLGAADTNWNNAINWSGNVIPGSYDQVVIPDASTTDYDPTLPTNTDINEIVIQPGGILNGGNGILTLNQNGIVSGSTWENNGTFNAGTSTIVFGSGTGTATIGSINGTSTTFNNLTINNSHGVLLTQNALVNSTLSLTSGRLDIGTNILSLGNTANAIAGTFNSNKMIVGDGGGEVRKNCSNTSQAAFLFPIGDGITSANGSEYSPISFSFSSGSFSSAYVGVKLANVKHPNNANVTNYLNRYWNISTSGISSPVYSVNATYLTGDVIGTDGTISAGTYSGSLPWIKYSSVNTTTKVITLTGINLTNCSISGINTINPSSSITGGGITICNPTTVTLGTSVTADPPITYQWSTSARTDSIAVSPSTTTGYTMTAIDGNGFTSVSSTTLTVNQPPTISNAGSNQTICISGASLSANIPSIGTGVWSIISGPSNHLSQFSNINNANSTFIPDGA